MAWNGAGVFNRLFSWTADKAAAINITASRVDSDTNDIVTQGLGNCITRDGQGQPTANLPMATFRHTGVGDGSARTDYTAVGQTQDGKLNWAVAGGGADTLTATYVPALTALVDGQLCFVRAVAANATTTPTFAPNGLTAHTITKVGGASLAVNDIQGTGHELILRYKLSTTNWELLNPSAPIVYSNDAGAAVGPSLDIFRDSASPAVSDAIGSVDFNGRDSGAAKQLYARVVALITDPTAASEDANIFLQAVIAGTLTTVLQNNGNTLLSALPFNPTNTTAAFLLSGGTTGQRNGSPATGETRYNTSLNVLEYWDGTRWVISIATTRQYLLSGTGATYTTPAGCRSIIIKMIGGGGGGGAAITNTGSTGGTTTFNSINAVGGSGGVPAGTVGRAGGIGGTGGTGSASQRFAGSAGGNGSATTTGGGNGGSGIFGAGAGLGGPAATAQNGVAAAANTGAGGGGAVTAGNAAGGGGAGEYVEIVITAPAATYTYTVGAVGAGGTAGTNAGGNGGTGMIIVEEYY